MPKGKKRKTKTRNTLCVSVAFGSSQAISARAAPLCVPSMSSWAKAMTSTSAPRAADGIPEGTVTGTVWPPIMAPRVEGTDTVHSCVTATSWDANHVPIIYLTQAESNGRVVQYTLKLMQSTLLREPMPPTRVIQTQHHDHSPRPVQVQTS